MKIKSIELCNFRGFKKKIIQLSPDLTVFAGINGSGKSTVLDAISIMLSWLVKRIQREGGQGRHISNMDIKNGESESYLDILLIHTNKNQHIEYRWSLTRSIKGKTTDHKSSLSGVSKLAEYIRNHYQETGLPVFAYYPIHRNVLDIPLRIRKKHAFEVFECYDEALTSAANFRHFFEWFRNREDLENEKIKELYQETKRNSLTYEDMQLKVVRLALKSILPEFSDFSIRRNPLCMVAKKESQELRIEQLSDGEKILIAMIGDIARRLAIANPEVDNPLEKEGIILIDEIDLHLHPSWQRMVVPKLREVFPNCQFIITTHSPQVLGEVEAVNVRCLYLEDDGDINIAIPNQTLGLASNEILDGIMRPNGNKTIIRNQQIADQLGVIFTLIDDENFDEAKKHIARLKNLLHGNIPELIHAESIIAMLDPES